MSPAMISALVWLVGANVIGMFPCKNRHWPQAYGLILVGLPVLVWVWASDGWLYAGLVFLAAASILRWPVRFFLRWLRGHLPGQGALPPTS